MADEFWLIYARFCVLRSPIYLSSCHQNLDAALIMGSISVQVAAAAE